MVKCKTFPLKDGGEGKAYYPEVGDIVTSRFAKVGTNQHPAIISGKAVIIYTYFLGVTTNTGTEITLTLSEGQKKVLDKTEDLTGKKIIFEKYRHKKLDKELLGARIKKESEK